MPSILHYPSYTPSRLELRSLLLYYDKVHSIIPWVDQPHVRAREHVQEILDIDNTIFKSIDPAEGYGAWIGNLDEMRAFKNIIENVKKKNDPISIAIEKRRNSSEVFPTQPEQDELVGSMRKHGWTIVAHQKIPPSWIDFMQRENAALKLGVVFNTETNQVIEENPVLMPGIAADFLLSQLARTISHTRGIPGTSYKERAIANQLYDPRTASMKMRTDILTLTLPLVIPENLDTITIGDYREIRESNEQVRKDINNLLEALVIKYEIDSAADANQYRDRVSTAVSEIAKNVADTEKGLRRKKFSTPAIYCVDFFATVGGAAMGELIGGGPGGAAAGATLGFLGAKASKSLSTLSPENHNNLITSLASTRSRIIRDSRRSKLSRPSYMI